MNDASQDAVLRARSLLVARSNKVSSKPTFYTQHNLTSRLNRDKFSGTLIINCITMDLFESIDKDFLDREDANYEKVCERGITFSISHFTLQLHHRTYDSRISFSIRSANASDKGSENANTTNCFLLCGKGTEFITSRSQYGDTTGEKFFQVAIEIRKPNKNDREKYIHEDNFRVKMAVGTIESYAELKTFAHVVASCILAKNSLKSKRKLYTSENDPRLPRWERYHHKFMCSHTLYLQLSPENSNLKSKFRKIDISINMESCGLHIHDRNSQLISLVIDGIKNRLVRSLSPITTRNKGQIELRINNLRLIEFLEDDNSSTVFGQKIDTKSIIPFLQIRLKSQLVPKSETGGWTVETEETKNENILVSDCTHDQVAWNIHIGIEFQALDVNTSSNIMKKMKYFIDHIRCAIENNRSKFKEEIEISFHPPYFFLRYRLDLMIKGGRFILPSKNIPLNKIKEASLLINYDLAHLCFQHDACGGMSSMKYSLVNFCALRKSDHWLLLEPINFRFEGSFLSEKKENCIRSSDYLEMPASSKWYFQEVNESLHPVFTSSIKEINAPITISFSPVHINISSRILKLLLDSVQLITNTKWNGKSDLCITNKSSKERKQSFFSDRTNRSNFHVMLAFSLISLNAKKETQLASSSYRTDPLSLILLESFAMTVSSAPKHSKKVASAVVKIKCLSIFDLSCLPPVRVFGPQFISKPNFQLSLSGSVGRDEQSSNRSLTLNISVILGDSQFLILPSFFENIVRMKHDLEKYPKSRGNMSSKKYESDLPIMNSFHIIRSTILPSTIRLIQYSFKNEGFELIFPTRVVANTLRDQNPINVVALRWASSLEGHKCLCVGDEMSHHESTTMGFKVLDQLIFKNRESNLLEKLVFDEQEPKGAAFEMWEKWKKHHQSQQQNDNQNVGPGQSPKLECLLVLLVKMEISKFQILRTCISQNRISSFSLAPTQIRKTSTFDPSNRQRIESQCIFVVTPPSAGEQQIISPFNFYIKYSGVVTLFDSLYANPTETVNMQTLDIVNFAHALQVEFGFIDAMIYVRQSSEGFNEALKVSIYPIINLIKSEKHSKDQDEESISRNGHSNLSQSSMRSSFPTQMQLATDNLHVDSLYEEQSKSLFLALLKRSMVNFSCRVGGIQVTYVPGGATRFTEAPIMKCSMNALKLGAALTPLPKRSENIEENPIHLIGSSLEMAFWISFELSAHYQNRRLVSWEPFIEPWTLNIRLGADLSKLFKLRYERWIETSHLLIPTHSLASPSHALVDEKSNTWNSNTMRDIGRRLLSMNGLQQMKGDFKNGYDDDLQSFHHIGLLEYTSDLSHLLLHFIAPVCLSLSLYNESHDILDTERSDRRSEDFQNKIMFPRGEHHSWLRLHGLPSSLDTDRNEKMEYSIVVAIRDANPLNINLTSTLIENLSGFFSNMHSYSNPSPHSILNNCGLPIRFREDLDEKRIEQGEKSSFTFLASGEEVSLSLKRRMSQTCDPHQAHIYVEIDNFASRENNFENMQFHFKSSYFRAIGRIPVDMVGVYEYPLQRVNDNQITGLNHTSILSHFNKVRDVGTIIVRVALIGGAKVVSVESPLLIKNISNTILSCTLKDKTGHKYWNATISPKNNFEKKKGEKLNLRYSALNCVSVPPIFVPSESVGFLSLHVNAVSEISINSESNINLKSTKHTKVLRFPYPFSEKSTSRGLIKESDLKLELKSIYSGSSEDAFLSSFVHVNACSLRIGKFSGLEKFNVSKFDLNIPEQRMLLVRSPVAIRNHLPVSIFLQVRCEQADFSIYHSSSHSADWENLGVLKCGETASWGGALSSDSVVFRIRLVDDNTTIDESSTFPTFSSPITIPSKDNIINLENFILRTTVTDKHGIPLDLSVSLEEKRDGNIENSQDNILLYSSLVPSAARVVAIHVPFWIVDETGMDIEFKSELPISGQVHKDMIDDDIFQKHNQQILPTGLSGVLRDSNLDAGSPFLVHMVGDRKATKLSIRRYPSNNTMDLVTEYFALPWSDPISLNRQKSMHRISVATNESAKSMALNCRILPAPEMFGGKYGTRLIHVVNRYTLSNALGRNLEVMTKDKNNAIILPADTKIPFHFDDSDNISIRPKEYGWKWSGSFNLKKKRKQINVRLRNKLADSTIIVNIEFLQTSKLSGTTLITFKVATLPPFRIENETLHPIEFYQGRKQFRGFYNASNDSVDTLLPYHSAPYCWDEPDDGLKLLSINMAEAESNGFMFVSPSLGNVYLDELAPGLSIALRQGFSLDVTADGPTRVFRLTNSNLPKIVNEKEGEAHTSRINVAGLFTPNLYHPHHIDVILAHGFGISVVDGEPKELLYARLEDVAIDRYVNGNGSETMEFTIGSMSVDNQLWVTPYPVLLKLGSRNSANKSSVRRRKRRKRAASFSWCRQKYIPGVQDELTLLRSLDIFLQPMIIRVDGNLVDQLIRMQVDAMHAGGASVELIKSTNSWLMTSRDDKLTATLGDSTEHLRIENQRKPNNYAKSILDKMDDLRESSGLVITAAMASKAHKNYMLIENHNTELNDRVSHSIDSRVNDYQSKKLAPQKSQSFQKKIYIESLKISSMKIELSWDGPLPAFFNLPTFIRPALTFEGFPVMLRPYSINHAYDTGKDHLQSLKSHYVNMGGVLDLVMGLIFKPIFLFRTTIYTSRYYTASSLKSLSNFLLFNREKLLTMVHPRIQPSLKMISWFLGVSSNTTSILASLFSYKNRKAIGSPKAGVVGNSTRLRPPRLFANQDGKDLLVEHVEGENVGKALLSRVKLGMYLGEGYVYHSEGVRIGDVAAYLRHKWTQDPFIAMITGKRLLALKNLGNLNFCSTFWEVSFNVITLVEFKQKNVSNENTFIERRDEIGIWYLVKKPRATGVSDNAMNGLDSLQYVCMQFKYREGQQFLSKLLDVEPTLATHTLLSQALQSDQNY